jgi:hypothetical protein
MENTTMTIDATHLSRVRSVCPEAGRILLAGTRGWVNGTAVPTVTAVPASVRAMGQAPTFYVGDFGTIKDLAFRPFGEPPV